MVGVPVYPSYQGPFCITSAGLNIICMLSLSGIRDKLPLSHSAQASDRTRGEEKHPIILLEKNDMSREGILFSTYGRYV